MEAQCKHKADWTTELFSLLKIHDNYGDDNDSDGNDGDSDNWASELFSFSENELRHSLWRFS